ncbi:hypothetical protein NHG97_29400 [Pseudomonas corrugata]|uniref:hypothetical protein n=1 Tax=Pseudomonas corrugata TaxID=47879 RepID=UPI0028C48C2A|nr:hypothetical protein [Pseudomonas corrugata]MDU9042811.1 hypothetical protein [Pseudomonas corrugata]
MATNQPAFIEPVLFLFSDVDQLKSYDRFIVERSFQTREYRTTSVTMFYVVGEAAGKREVIAEFPVEIQATIFRDMAEATARAKR